MNFIVFHFCSQVCCFPYVKEGQYELFQNQQNQADIAEICVVNLNFNEVCLFMMQV